MRIQIRNCVTDPRYKHLRQAGTPVFKPVILSKPLPQGAIRIVSSSEFSYADVAFLSQLVSSGSCTALEIGKGPVDFDKWLSTFDESTEAIVEEPPVVEEIEEIIEEESIMDAESVEEAEPEAVEEVVEEEESALYDEESLLSLRNAELRSIVQELDPSASVANKSKKKLISLIMDLQNG